MIARTSFILGPAYAMLGSTAYHLSGDATVNPVFENIEITDALAGTVDEFVKNRMAKRTHRPLYYDPSVTLSLFWPWTSLAATPVGTLLIATTDATHTIVGNNGDNILFEAAAVTKMPDLFLGVESEFFASDMEVSGMLIDGDDPSTASSLIVPSVSNDFAVPAIPSTSKLGRHKFTAVWGEFTGFTSFQAFKGFRISHELKLQPQTDNGQIVDWSIISYRCMARCISSGNTMANLLAAMAFTGSGAAQGQQLSAKSADLVITGSLPTSVTVTLENAALKTAGFRFSGQELRQGEVGFVSTNIAATDAGLILA